MPMAAVAFVAAGVATVVTPTEVGTEEPEEEEEEEDEEEEDVELTFVIIVSEFGVAVVDEDEGEVW